VDSHDKDAERIHDAKEEIRTLMNQEELKDASLLVLANKQDLPKAMNLHELTKQLELD
jgi:GTPase SAR1 family protein